MAIARGLVSVRAYTNISNCFVDQHSKPAPQYAVTSGSINCTTEDQHASCERRPRRTRFHGHGGLPDAPMMRMEHYDG